MDLTEAKIIKRRWQEYTEELYKKDLQDPDNHNGAITPKDSQKKALIPTCPRQAESQAKLLFLKR